MLCIISAKIINACPAPLPEEPQDFPTTHKWLQWERIGRFLFPCACDKFILFLITFRWTAFVPHCRPPFTPFVQFISPTSATSRHKWLPHFTSQVNPLIPFRCADALSSMLILCISCRGSTIHPLKHPAKLHSISTHCAVPFSRHLCLLSTHL